MLKEQMVRTLIETIGLVIPEHFSGTKITVLKSHRTGILVTTHLSEVKNCSARKLAEIPGLLSINLQ
jgi:hypothetical protein